AHGYLRGSRRLKSVQLKSHDVETSLIEGVLSRGDRRVSQAIESVWRRGARMDSWWDYMQPDRGGQALAETGVDGAATWHEPYALDAKLPWDHINVKKGRAYLEKEQSRSVVQLAAMK